METRKLDHDPALVFIQHDYPFYSAVMYNGAKWMIYYILDETGAFKKFDSGYSDWYVAIALEKLKLITSGTELINYSLVMSYRWAIREGYNHQLDSALQNPYDRPRHRNTIIGVLSYIKRIERASAEEMKAIQNL